MLEDEVVKEINPKNSTQNTLIILDRTFDMSALLAYNFTLGSYITDLLNINDFVSFYNFGANPEDTRKESNKAGIKNLQQEEDKT